MTRKQISLATIGLLLANFMGGLDTTLLNVALSQIVSDMHAVNEVGLLTSILLFTIAVTTVLWGKFAEKIGNKKAFVIATVIFVVASTIGGLASSIWLLIIARAFMGIGIGGMVSIPFIIYIDLYPKLTDRATALGWVTAFYAVATILGPIIGGMLKKIIVNYANTVTLEIYKQWILSGKELGLNEVIDRAIVLTNSGVQGFFKK